MHQINLQQFRQPHTAGRRLGGSFFAHEIQTVYAMICHQLEMTKSRSISSNSNDYAAKGHCDFAASSECVSVPTTYRCHTQFKVSEGHRASKARGQCCSVTTMHHG